MSACAACKKGKRKCDGATPCARCVALDRECVKIAPKKRGRPSSTMLVTAASPKGAGAREEEPDRTNEPVLVKKSQQKLLSIILASEHAMMVRPRDLVGTFGLDLGENFFGVQFPDNGDADFKLPDFDNIEEVFSVYTPIICGGRIFVAQSAMEEPVLQHTVGRSLSEVLVQIQTAEDRDDPRARRLMEVSPGAPSIKRLDTGIPRAVRLGMRSETFSVTGRSIWFFNERGRPVLSFICMRKVERVKEVKTEPLYGGSGGNAISIFFDDENLTSAREAQNPFYVDGWAMDGVFDLN